MAVRLHSCRSTVILRDTQAFQRLAACRSDRCAAACALILCFALLSAIPCHGAKVVFIPASGGSPETHQTLDIAARFYGIDLTSISPTAVHDYVSLRSSVSAPTTVAVVVAARALADLSQTAFLSAMASRPGGSAPLLITGLTAETDAGLLKSWSDGAVLGCSRLDGLNRPTYVVAGGADITGPLTRMEYPALNKHPFYLIPGEHSRTQNLLNIRDRGRTYPVFVLASRKDQQLFLDVSVPAPVGATSTDVLSAFTELAPLLMFLKYSAGDRGWHSLHHYANLTIDDPRLQQPYGLFDYERLLSAMQAHRFHTTIAFIPWNYDRNDPRVASLIRKHPDRFSIAIHGDNHDHREFTGYETKPLPVQVAALRQALARMDTFRTLTAIPYDKVMVFPHAIAPENTLQALKDNGYLATVNSSNIPLGSPIPANALFHLRSVTLKFGGIPSLLRYSVAVPVPTYLIGLQTFLDNPLLFYCHHDFFLTGSDAFNKIADDVNTRDPNVQWTSLGDIVRHFYLVKLRDDSDYDVSAYSSEFDLENVAQRKVVFHVRKLEAGSRRVASLIVDGDPQPFVSRDGYLEVDIKLPAGHTSRVKVEYEPVLLPAVEIDKRSPRVYLLRTASEFRDNVLYRAFMGRTLITLYYRNGAAFYLIAALVIIAGCVGIACLRFSPRRRAVKHELTGSV